MSEDEDCDDLPMIKVNSSASDSSSFAMPSAEELASQRARELACEHELRKLRERAAADERGAAPPPPRRDSSGSEGEAALAAGVTALRVRPRAAAPPAAALWAALLPHLPPGLPRRAPAALQRAVAGVAAAPGARPDDDMLCACALLVTALLARESRGRRTAARALHALLDEHATPAQAARLGGVLAAAFPEARARLQLSDALRSGGEAGADRASAALAQAAMLQLLAAEGGEGAGPQGAGPPGVGRVARAAGAWRGLGAAARYQCVQLAGRLLAGSAPRAAEREARAALLAQLAPPAAASDAQRPDRLKVLVGASKLRLLFRAEQ